MPASLQPAIRLARSADAAALAALELRCFPGDRMSLRQYRRHLARASNLILVAHRDRALVGSAVVLFRSGSAVGRMYSIAVDPSARGMGLGSALLGACERRARRRGAQVLNLEVRQDNAEAIAMYVARGYRRIGMREAYYDDGADAWRYQHKLGPARAGN
jgi:ribosomal protein S18 acetylase RimI-like enzyme